MKRKLVESSDLFSSRLSKGLYGIVKPVVDSALGIRKINKHYEYVQDITPPEQFAEAVLKTFKVDFHISSNDVERLQKIEGPLVIVANHPFGGIDALFMVVLLSKIRKPYKVMANYLVKRIPEVSEVLIGVDPFEGKDAVQKNMAPLKEAMQWLKEGGLLGIFPSGEVASFKWKHRRVMEKPWSVSVAKLIQKTGATVVPLYFHGQNRWTFQLAAAIHPRLQTAMLINALVHPAIKKIHYQIGNPISPEKIKEFQDPQELIQYLYGKTYLLSGRYPSQKISFNIVKPFLPRLTKEDEPPEPIISPVESEALHDEVKFLHAERKLLSYQNFDVLCFGFDEAPMMIREIGRLREVTFREVGEGTGKAIDLDEYDHYYLHLCIWDNAKQKIVGAYRMGKADEILKNKGIVGLYTYSLFKMKKELLKTIHPALEMGRSFIVKEYQRTFAPLMLLWSGIGHFVAQNPQYKYLFGPVSISNDFNDTAKDLMVFYLNEHSQTKDLTRLVKPRKKFRYQKKSKFYNSFSIKDIQDVQELIQDIEHSGMKVPVLLKQYLNLGGKILAFNVDPDFNDVLDGLIFVDLTQTKPDILVKYMGYEGYKNFMNYHKLSIPAEIIKKYGSK